MGAENALFASGLGLHIATLAKSKVLTRSKTSDDDEVKTANLLKAPSLLALVAAQREGAVHKLGLVRRNPGSPTITNSKVSVAGATRRKPAKLKQRNAVIRKAEQGKEEIAKKEHPSLRSTVEDNVPSLLLQIHSYSTASPGTTSRREGQVDLSADNRTDDSSCNEDEEFANLARSADREKKHSASKIDRPTKAKKCQFIEVNHSEKTPPASNVWTEEEERRLNDAVEKFLGKPIDWKLVAAAVANPNFSEGQCADHFYSVLETGVKRSVQCSHNKPTKKSATATNVNGFSKRDPLRKWRMNRALRAQALKGQTPSLFDAMATKDGGTAAEQREIPPQSRRPRLSFLNNFHTGLTPPSAATKKEETPAAESLGEVLTRDIIEERYIEKHKKQQRACSLASSRKHPSSSSLAEITPKVIKPAVVNPTKVIDAIVANEKRANRIHRKSLEYQRENTSDVEERALLDEHLAGTDNSDDDSRD